MIFMKKYSTSRICNSDYNLARIQKSGKTTVHGKIAYTSQDPWIQNMTLQSNILFGREYDAELYEETVRVCGLEPDLEVSMNMSTSDMFYAASFLSFL